MSFSPLQPLLVDDESGELAIDTYTPWFFPDNHLLLITPSHYMALSTIIDLFEDEEITEEQAKLNESAFVLNGWVWADQPHRNKPTLQQIMMRNLLLKDEDYEED